MSKIHPPEHGKLIVALLFSNPTIQMRTWHELTLCFGPLDLLTEPKPFTYSRYYEREMGQGLKRQIGSFKKLTDPGRLADIKLLTNELEDEMRIEGARQVNIDPGLLEEHRLVLATTKNAAHRVYLKNGIYADLTLVFERGSYRPLPWTYPDYREATTIHFLVALRSKLLYQKHGKIPKKIKSQGGR